MELTTNIAQTIDRNSLTAKYDTSVKEMLADKQIMARILKYSTNEEAPVSKNHLIAMLEELLKRDDPESKKHKLEESYGIIMNVDTEKRVNTMCNLSEVVLEKGIVQSILTLLDGYEIPNEVVNRLYMITDSSLLNQLLKKAAVVDSLEEFVIYLNEQS